MTIKEQAAKMKLDSSKMAVQTNEKRNEALKKIVESLKNNRDMICEANKKDLDNAKEEGLLAPVLKRLKFDDSKLESVIEGIEGLISLPDPLAVKQLEKKLDTDLILERVSCPIGVIGVIFESRPDALVQISTLCLKSGNCAILKGGKEAINTNKALFKVIYEAALDAGMPEGCMFLAQDRSEIAELLSCHESVDLLIPRGSNQFVQYIMSNTKIPVMGHADGICHIYADEELDIDQAINVIVDSKTQYTAVCNATETLLVNKNIADKLLPKLNKAFLEKNVEVRGTDDVSKIIECEKATEEDFSTEYLDLIISIKLVDTVDEAVEHINKYGSHHTDCILTTNEETAERFMQYVDSAGVYHNCSTRFADGFRYGFGAEVGISTGKLHARGPVGLEGLCTYKYRLHGNGNIVDDYATGKKKFKFETV